MMKFNMQRLAESKKRKTQADQPAADPVPKKAKETAPSRSVAPRSSFEALVIDNKLSYQNQLIQPSRWPDHHLPRVHNRKGLLQCLLRHWPRQPDRSINVRGHQTIPIHFDRNNRFGEGVTSRDTKASLRSFRQNDAQRDLDSWRRDLSIDQPTNYGYTSIMDISIYFSFSSSFLSSSFSSSFLLFFFFYINFLSI